LRLDALNHHPLLGYDYAELKDFPRSSPSPALTATSSSTASVSPCLSPIPSFKEVPAFQLNSPTQEDTLYQHFYQKKENKLNHPSSPPAPILLSPWTTSNKKNIF
jgi:hypothetical protein